MQTQCKLDSTSRVLKPLCDLKKTHRVLAHGMQQHVPGAAPPKDLNKNSTASLLRGG